MTRLRKQRVESRESDNDNDVYRIVDGHARVKTILSLNWNNSKAVVTYAHEERRLQSCELAKSEVFNIQMADVVITRIQYRYQRSTITAIHPNLLQVSAFCNFKFNWLPRNRNDRFTFPFATITTRLWLMKINNESILNKSEFISPKPNPIKPLSYSYFRNLLTRVEFNLILHLSILGYNQPLFFIFWIVP